MYMKNSQKRSILFSLLLVMVLGFSSCKNGETGPAGPEGSAGVEGPSGPKGLPGNANVLSSTYRFSKRDINQYGGTANIQIPSVHILEPEGFDGAFMSYLTNHGDLSFGGFSSGATLPLPFSWYNNPTASMASAFAYRTIYNTYYFIINYHGSSSNSFPFLSSGEFSLRLVWIPKAVIELHPKLNLHNPVEVMTTLNIK